MAIAIVIMIVRIVRRTLKGLTSRRPIVIPYSGLSSILLGRKYDTIFIKIRK
jgi:hypothetical protein